METMFHIAVSILAWVSDFYKKIYEKKQTKLRNSDGNAVTFFARKFTA